jgi:glycosyltransferase involved in cell wall biosynthesis
MNQRPSVTVIVPAYNEEELIGGVIDDVKNNGSDFDLEIIMIEGGSGDRTAEVARDHGATVISLPRKRGKGADFWTAACVSKGEYIIQIDADHQFQPSQLHEMMALFERGADVVLGTRFRAGAQNEPGSIHPLNDFGNRLLSFAVTLMIGQRITDTMAGYKGIRRAVIPTLQLHVPHFGYEAELVIRAARAGWKIVEMPVIYKTRHNGVSNVRRIKDGFRVLWSIIVARWTPLATQVGTCAACTGPMRGVKGVPVCFWCGGTTREARPPSEPSM